MEALSNFKIKDFQDQFLPEGMVADKNNNNKRSFYAPDLPM